MPTQGAWDPAYADLSRQFSEIQADFSRRRQNASYPEGKAFAAGGGGGGGAETKLLLPAGKAFGCLPSEKASLIQSNGAVRIREYPKGMDRSVATCPQGGKAINPHEFQISR
jgi:hypothetical protein